MLKAKIIVAGRKTIGLPLIDTLKSLGHQVLCSFTRRYLWDELSDEGSTRLRSIDLSEPTEAKLAEVLDSYCKRGVDDKEPKADVAFIAIPSYSKSEGREEMELIRYFHSRNVYVILFAKGAMAYRYKELEPHLDNIGRRAVVGGRISVLPWLQMHNLRGKVITVHGVLNASNNMFFSECSNGSSMEEAFRSVKLNGLAEPGATDVDSFVNGEFQDTILKMCVTFNEGFAPSGGPFITPDKLQCPTVTLDDLRAITLPSRRLRPIVRISKSLSLPLEFEKDFPGSMYSEHEGYQFSLGFYDLGRESMLARWVGEGAWNGLRVQHDDDGEGPLTIGGLGAGPRPTIGAALCDLADYLRKREQMFPKPEREKTSQRAVAKKMSEVDESIA